MNWIIRRRRAIMGMANEKTIALKDVPIGAYVRLSKTGTVDWIYCGLMGGNAQLLRDQVNGTSKLRNDTLCDYEGGVIDTYLTGTYYNSLPEIVRSAMVESVISYPASDGTNIVTKTISRKVFLPVYEWLDSNSSGFVVEALKKNKNTTSTNTSRIAVDSNNTKRTWLTMSANTTTHMTGIGESGANGKYIPNNTYYRRPMMSFSPNTPVVLVGGRYVMKL